MRGSQARTFFGESWIVIALVSAVVLVACGADGLASSSQRPDGLPEWFPAELAVPEGTVVVEHVTEEPGPQSGTLFLRTEDATPEQIKDFFAEELQDDGWRVKVDGNGGYEMEGVKGAGTVGERLLIGVTPSGQGSVDTSVIAIGR